MDVVDRDPRTLRRLLPKDRRDDILRVIFPYDWIALTLTLALVAVGHLIGIAATAEFGLGRSRLLDRWNPTVRSSIPHRTD
jgi:hypothetical protein